MKLYEIKQQIENCIKTDDDLMVDTETGEVFDSEAFEALEGQFEDKCLDLGRWIKNLKAEAEAISAEKTKLAKRQKAIENKAASIESYLATVLNGREMKDANTSLSYRKSVSTEVDLKVLMGWDNCDEYLKYSEPEANKKDIAKALKAGKVIPGCQLIEKKNLQIK